MFLKTHRVRKDGKEHVYYSLCESLRVSRSRVTQRTVLHLGELNTPQLDRWERTIETVHEDGRRQQLRLFTDREGRAPAADDVAEVVLSSLVVRRPRRFGECWIGCKLWEELGLRAFWDQALGGQRGEVPWAKVVELLVVNRLADQVFVVYEAGPGGFHLHRQLTALGATAFVVHPVKLDPQHKGVVTDKTDARELTLNLARYLRGNLRAMSLVRVPTPAEEQRRALSRQREQLRRERQRLAAQGRSLCLTQPSFHLNG
jgi:hypothetical protein